MLPSNIATVSTGGGANAQREGNEREEDAAGAESGHAGDDGTDQRSGDEDRPAEDIGHGGG